MSQQLLCPYSKVIPGPLSGNIPLVVSPQELLAGLGSPGRFFQLCRTKCLLLGDFAWKECAQCGRVSPAVWEAWGAECHSGMLFLVGHRDTGVGSCFGTWGPAISLSPGSWFLGASRGCAPGSPVHLSLTFLERLRDRYHLLRENTPLLVFWMIPAPSISDGKALNRYQQSSQQSSQQSWRGGCISHSRRVSLGDLDQFWAVLPIL